MSESTQIAGNQTSDAHTAITPKQTHVHAGVNTTVDKLQATVVFQTYIIKWYINIYI